MLSTSEEGPNLALIAPSPLNLFSGEAHIPCFAVEAKYFFFCHVGLFSSNFNRTLATNSNQKFSTKEVLRYQKRQSSAVNRKKDRQYNDQKKKYKRAHNDMQNITQKTKD